jgi:hypothetical protein
MSVTFHWGASGGCLVARLALHLFTLAAISVIGQAALTGAESVATYLLYVLGADALLLAPIVLSLRSSTRFDAAAGWLEAHERLIVIVVSLVLGSFFVWSGVQGLAR